MLSAATDLRALRDLVRKYRSERPDHEVPFLLQLSAARSKATTSLQWLAGVLRWLPAVRVTTAAGERLSCVVVREVLEDVRHGIIGEPEIDRAALLVSRIENQVATLAVA